MTRCAFTAALLAGALFPSSDLLGSACAPGQATLSCFHVLWVKLFYFKDFFPEFRLTSSSANSRLLRQAQQQKYSKMLSAWCSGLRTRGPEDAGNGPLCPGCAVTGLTRSYTSRQPLLAHSQALQQEWCFTSPGGKTLQSP